MGRSGTEARVSRGIAFLLFAVLVLSVLATLSLPGPVQPAGVPSPAAASGPNPPRGIHLSYLEDPTSAVFTWHTTSAASSRADWGTTPGGPYEFTANGTNYTSPGGSFLHTVTLTGLTPGLRYYYRVGDEAMASSYGEASFRAALPNGSSETFSFAASGDWSNSGNSATTSNGIGARDPNLVVPLGDLYYSTNESRVKGVYEKFQAFGQGSFIQAVIGNHEHLKTGDASYTPTEVHCAFVNLPGNERTYSFKFGNTLFLAIDWGRDSGNTSDGVDASGAACGGAMGTSAIRSWLDARLAAANLDNDIRWKVVVQHFQCYDMTTLIYTLMCPDGSKPLDQMEDIMNNRGVDLVVNGHEHSYGRTHPVRFHTAVQTGSSYDTPGAPIYLTIGTAGASHTATCRTDAWVGHCRASILTHGFGHFRVSPTSIQYEFVDNSAGVVDSFTLTKRSATDFAVSVEPVAGSLMRSGATTANVSVLGNSSDPVTLSVSGCPADTACTFSPATGSPSFASTFRIETSPSSPFGSFDLVISATNASVSKTVPYHLTITDRISRSYQKGDGGAFSETDDTHIYSGTPDGNFGTNVKLFVDGSGCIAAGSVCKTLIKFPLLIGPASGQIPVGATIASASLTLNIRNKGLTQDAYQVTEAWNESTATWNGFATPGVPGNRGREFTFAPTVLGPFSINLTSIVQRWANGEANEGILLASAHSDGVDYDSSEAVSGRPILRVEFLPPSDGPPPPFDFSLSISPSSGSVVPGDSVSATATATLVSGSTHDVLYSCSDLPSEATCTFTPPACSPTCTSSVLIATSPSTPEGTYALTIHATDGTISRTAGFTLTIATAPPPPSPVPTALAIGPTSPDPSIVGQSVALSAVLTRADTGVPLSGKTVAFEGSDDNGGTWWSAATSTTDSTGRANGATVFLTPGAKLLRAQFAGDDSFQASTSGTETHVVDTLSVLSFRKGDGSPYSETDDAFIYNGLPNNNYGSHVALFVDASGCIAANTVCRSLLKFPDIVGPNSGQVPPGSVIVSATLELTITNAGGTQLLYQVTEAWTEAGVTWNGFATPGSPGSKGTTISFSAPVGVITVNITGIVQNWANGDPNHGIFIWSTSTNGADYRSSDSTAPPVLTVTFRPPPPPPMELRGSAAELPEDTGSPQEATVPTIRRLEVRTREPC